MAINKGKKFKSLTDKQFAKLEADILKLNNSIDFSVQLSTSERRDIPKMGDLTLPFVEKALHYGDHFPNIVPPILDMAQFHESYRLARQMNNLLKKISPVAEKISDTYLAAGADAYLAARQVYGYAKYASNGGEPPAAAIVEDLKKRYERSRRKPKTPINNTPTSEPTNQESSES